NARLACLNQPNTGITKRHLVSFMVKDCEKHRPDAIAGSIDRVLIAKLREIIGLARLKARDRWMARTVQHDWIMLRQIAEKLPFGSRKCIENGLVMPARDFLVVSIKFLHGRRIKCHWRARHPI